MSEGRKSAIHWRGQVMVGEGIAPLTATLESHVTASPKEAEKMLHTRSPVFLRGARAWQQNSPAPAELSGHKKRGGRVFPTPTFAYYRAANAALAARRASCGLALCSTRAWIAAA